MSKPNQERTVACGNQLFSLETNAAWIPYPAMSLAQQNDHPKPRLTVGTPTGMVKRRESKIRVHG